MSVLGRVEIETENLLHFAPMGLGKFLRFNFERRKMAGKFLRFNFERLKMCRGIINEEFCAEFE